MREKQNKNIPDGTRDIIYREADLYSDITDRFKTVFAGGGYKRIMTPAIEYYDVFDYAAQPISQEEMYKMTDKNGRLIILRADNTTPAARVAATKLRNIKSENRADEKNEKFFEKLYYNQCVYRYNGDYSGKHNEIMQSGAEIIGVGGVKSDLACIITAIEVLKTLNLNYKIEIGHVGYINALLCELDLSEDEERLVRVYIDSKNAVSLNIMNKIQNLDYIRRLPFLFGGTEVFEKAYKIAADNVKAKEALEYVENLYSLLSCAGYGGDIMVDMGIVHKIDYYTGVVFSGYLDGVGEAILSGGRYDNLIENFGYDVPATGFAVNVSLIADALVKVKRCENCGCRDRRIIFFAADKIKEAAEYYQNNADCEYSCFETYEDTLNYAKNNGIKHIVSITNDGTKVMDL
jgi:ATP phosphoribosyltransferase regulatory subunit